MLSSYRRSNRAEIKYNFEINFKTSLGNVKFVLSHFAIFIVALFLGLMSRIHIRKFKYFILFIPNIRKSFYWI